MIREFAKWRFVSVFFALGLLGVMVGYHGYSHGALFPSIGGSYQPFFGVLRGNRSDDWMVNFPIQVAQDRAQPSFTNNNEAIGGGESMNLVPPSILTRSVWSFFKPQNYGFLLGLDFGVSWQWVFTVMMLILSAFIFLRRSLKLPEVESALLSIAFYFSPLFQYWSLNPALHFAYFFIIWSTIESELSQTFKAMILVFCGMAWVLLLYPPFMVPLLLLLLFLTIARIQHSYQSEWKTLIAAAFLFFSVFGLWVFDQLQLISVFSSTVYPGQRVSLGGSLTFLEFFGNSFFSIRHTHPNELGANQSEAANFIQFVPFLILMVAASEWRKLQSYFIPLLAFLLLLLSYQFLGLPAVLAKFTLLSMTTPVRSWVGIGIGNFILMGIWIAIGNRDRIPKFLKYLIVLGFLTLGWWINFNEYGLSRFIIPGIIISAMGSGVLMLLLVGYHRLALGLYLFLSVAMSGHYNPISFRGLESALASSKMIMALNQVKKESKPGAWIVLDDFILGNIPRLLPVKSYGGVHVYPDFKLWHQLDPEGQFEQVWNRYAHVMFVYDPIEKGIQFRLLDPNAFQVRFGPTAQLPEKLGVQVMISPCFSINPALSFRRVRAVGLEKCAYELNERAQ